MSGIVKELIFEAANLYPKPQQLVIDNSRVGELADHFLSLRKMRGSGFEKVDLEEMIRLGHVKVAGIPVKVAA